MRLLRLLGFIHDEPLPRKRGRVHDLTYNTLNRVLKQVKHLDDERAFLVGHGGSVAVDDVVLLRPLTGQFGALRYVLESVRNSEDGTWRAYGRLATANRADGKTVQPKNQTWYPELKKPNK